MGYRDPAAAARERVRQAREGVERLEEQLTPALLEQMEGSDRKELQQRADRVSEQLPDELARLDRDTLLGALPLLADYERALGEAIQRAPRLAKRYNRLPRTFPERGKVTFRYEFMDIYQRSTKESRAEIHDWIRRLDPKANVISARTRYDDEVMEPYLAEAELTVDRAPLRLQVLARHANNTDRAGLLIIDARAYALFVKTRPSTPALRLELQGLDDRLLKWLRLRDEPEIGHAEFDDKFFIHGTAEDARRVLRPEVHEPLLELTQWSRYGVEVTVDEGLARLQWVDPGRSSKGLELGVQAMVAVRNTPPVRLLRRRHRTSP